MQPLLRFNGARACDPAIDPWWDSKPAPLRELARQWFVALRACGADVSELLHDGCPVACVGDVPFGYVNCYTRHVNLGFYQGAGLPDPQQLLRGQGKFMRHISLLPQTRIDTVAVQALIAAAYADIHERIARGQ